MADNSNNWNEEEIVPMGELRPSREHFGPVPSRNDGAKGKQTPRAREGRSAQQPPAQARRPQAGPSGQPQRRPAQQPQSGQAQGQPQRQQRPQRPQGQERPQQSPQRGASRPRKQRPVRDEAFVNGLAADDRKSVIVKPSSGWRGALLKVTGVNVGLSAEERRIGELRQQIRRPVTEGTAAVFSRKGGVGKTTISAYLGATLAVERGGRILALDGDAEAGSLGWLLAPRAPSTLAALASADPIPNDYAEIRRYTVSTPEGLDVIVGDPAEMGPISTTGLEAVADQVARHYDVSIFDTGAGVTRATGRVLVNRARVLILVMGPSVDSVRAAERTLAWLDERPGEAADPDVKVIAVINGIPETAKQSHIDKIESHFSDRCDAVVRIPWDAHLAAGSTSVSLDRLAKPTRQAFLELAATTVATLARPVRRPAAAGARRA